MSTFDPIGEIPVARGHRDPSIAAELEAENLVDPHGPDQSFIGLSTGDRLVAKVSLEIPTELGDAWFTYGAETSVIDGESEVDAFNRLADVVNTRVLDLAVDATNRAAELAAQQRAAARTHRITPR